MSNLSVFVKKLIILIVSNNFHELDIASHNGESSTSSYKP